ncbi:Alpha/Beta hydrolase protein, partial [Vararia minispora EC-137]
GILALDVTPTFTSRPLKASETVVFVAHGLVGGSHDSYVRAALAHLSADRSQGGLGMRAIVMNSRGCNHSPVTTPKLYHAGATDDIRHAMLWIAKTFPDSPVYGLGFSLGANLLTKYVGEEAESCPLSAAVSIANPFDFVAVSKNVESFNKRIYNFAMGNAARALLARHRKVFEDSITISRDALDGFLKKRFVVLRDFDTAITAPVFGFAHPLEYYATVSSARFMSRIRIPFLGLNAADDPILGPDTLPLGDAYTNPWILLVRTQQGGHLGWFEAGSDGTLRRWFVKPVSEFLTALLEVCSLS